MYHLKFFLIVSVGLLLGVSLAIVLVIQHPEPEQITYGVSFNVPYTRELGLDYQEVFRAAVDELEIRHMRLAAHWPLIMPEEGKYNWEEMDFQMNYARENDVEVIFAVGRRLPRWPECHVPEWVMEKEWEEQKQILREYIREVVTRYKDYDNIIYWQVENEPFLTVFAYEHCGDLDVEFLDEEIALVKTLDPSRPILVTDSGNLGLWYGAYSRGDLFGTSLYLYLWNPEVGPFRSALPPAWYRLKAGIMERLYGEKEVLLIELSAEPWLLEPVQNAPIDVQLERMNIDKFNEIIEYAKETRLSPQYLWGVEWWYWLKERGYPEFWERARELYSK